MMCILIVCALVRIMLLSLDVSTVTLAGLRASIPLLVTVPEYIVSKVPSVPNKSRDPAPNQLTTPLPELPDTIARKSN